MFLCIYIFIKIKIKIKIKYYDKNMKLTDQPGRIFALVILCPGILYMSYKLYNDKISKEYVAIILTIFAVIFFFYELFWVIFHKPKEVTFVLGKNEEVKVNDEKTDL